MTRKNNKTSKRVRHMALIRDEKEQEQKRIEKLERRATRKVESQATIIDADGDVYMKQSEESGTKRNRSGGNERKRRKVEVECEETEEQMQIADSTAK